MQNPPSPSRRPGRPAAGARARRRLALGLLGAAALAGASGCRAFQEHRRALSALHEQGRYDLAAGMLDDPEVLELYEDKNELLWRMDRGATALALGDTAGTISELERAEAIIDLRRERTAGDELARWALNDTAAAYVAEPYEDMYLNVLKLAAQLEAGNIQGGATVEARRLASKANLLRDEYVRTADAVGRRYADELRRGGGPTQVNEAGEFIESPLGVYLSVVAFLESGDAEFARVASRRLLSAIDLQAGLVGGVRREEFEGLDGLSSEDADLLVVAFAGRGPTKRAEEVGPIPLGTFPLYFELPVLETHPGRSSRAVLEVEGEEPRELALVEDLSAVAAENHRRQMPLIYARTLIRSLTKAGLSAAATEAARGSVADGDQALVQIAGAAIGLALLYATERADLRAWTMLPGRAYVALADLPPGERRVRVAYLSPAGSVLHSTPWRTVRPGESALVTIVEHYWD